MSLVSCRRFTSVHNIGRQPGCLSASCPYSLPCFFMVAGSIFWETCFICGSLVTTSKIDWAIGDSSCSTWSVGWLRPCYISLRIVVRGCLRLEPVAPLLESWAVIWSYTREQG